MPDDDFIEIRVSKVIHAEKWKVIRFLTKIWKFPAYMTFVKEAQVLRKAHNRMRTKWKVEINKVPVSWIEEDILALDLNAIYFKAVEGDLEEFRGEWIFEDHPEGTKVNVNVHLKITIPIIKDFARDFMRKTISRNFEAILKVLEQHLISTKYAGYKNGNAGKIAGFGIVGHLYNFYHLEKCIKMLNPAFEMPSREFIGSLFHITPSFKLQDIIGFKSKTGQKVNGVFIMAAFIPDMIKKDMWGVFSKTVKACKIAEKYGVGIVSLGGLTSVVAEDMGDEFLRQVDVPVTTGNTFTAAMVIDGILKAAELLEVDISSAKAAIVGGTGDIGSACARAFADKVRHLTITGRPGDNFRRIAKELNRKAKSRIAVTVNNEEAVRGADIVIAAASATASILDMNWFKPGAIICDVGYPRNVSYTSALRDDILIFSGGLTRLPAPISFSIDLGLPDTSTIYGCFAESIILALEGRFESFSYGRGNITLEKIDEMRELGKKHGFELADFWWGDKLIDEMGIERIRESRRELL